MKTETPKRFSLPTAPVVGLLLLGLIAATLATAWFQITFVEHSWSYGGWRISYAVGFIRRGLGGTIVETLPFPPPVTVFCIIAAATTLLYHAVWQLTRSASPAVLLCLASPAALLFPIGDPNGAFRAEFLFLALFAHMLWLQTSGREDHIPKLTAALPALVLIHEITLFLLPALLPLLAPHRRSKHLWFALPATAVAGIAVTLWHGTPAQVTTLCATPTPACAPFGPAHTLAHTLAQARAKLSPLLANYAATFPWVAAFALAPLALALKPARLPALTWASLGATAASLTALASFASDWGRFLAAFSLIATLQIAAHTSPLKRLPLWAVPVAIALSLSWQLGHYNTLLHPGFAAEIRAQIFR